MNYYQIRPFDIANGEGLRASIFVTGCKFNCKGCFNKELQDFEYGELWTDKQTKEIITYLKSDHIKGLTILGGEPFEHPKELTNIIREIKKKVNKSIWIYSGYTIEQIKKDKDMLTLLKECDILVDGLYIEKLKDLSLKFRGSSNQRIINISEELCLK